MVPPHETKCEKQGGKKMEKKQPEISFKAGSITAAVWVNNVGKGDFYTISLKRDYKENDEWKTTNSLRVNDLPKARVVLEKAYEFAVMNKKISA